MNEKLASIADRVMPKETAWWIRSLKAESLEARERADREIAARTAAEENVALLKAQAALADEKADNVKRSVQAVLDHRLGPVAGLALLAVAYLTQPLEGSGMMFLSMSAFVGGFAILGRSLSRLKGSSDR